VDLKSCIRKLVQVVRRPWLTIRELLRRKVSNVGPVSPKLSPHWTVLGEDADGRRVWLFRAI
jgi:hypothetical protein